MLIWGTRTRVNLAALVHFVCGVCHQDAPQRILEQVKHFTIFFLPAWVMSRTWYTDCAGCGSSYPITEEYAQQCITWARQLSEPAPGATPDVS